MTRFNLTSSQSAKIQYFFSVVTVRYGREHFPWFLGDLYENLLPFCEVHMHFKSKFRTYNSLP